MHCMWLTLVHPWHYWCQMGYWSWCLCSGTPLCLHPTWHCPRGSAGHHSHDPLGTTSTLLPAEKLSPGPGEQGLGSPCQYSEHPSSTSLPAPTGLTTPHRHTGPGQSWRNRASAAPKQPALWKVLSTLALRGSKFHHNSFKEKANKDLFDHLFRKIRPNLGQSWSQERQGRCLHTQTSEACVPPPPGS